ncbi:MAG: hypothetical protein Kow00121_49110 [Elainellaceae cyanobacterium]
MIHIQQIKSRSWLGAIVSGAIASIPLIATPAQAGDPLWNPCLENYYVDLASNAPSPQNCLPATDAELDSSDALIRAVEPDTTLPTVLIVPPFESSLIEESEPEQIESAADGYVPGVVENDSLTEIYSIDAAEGIAIRLSNNMDSAVSYQVIQPGGYSNPQRLLAEQDIILRDLETPFTLQIVHESGQVSSFTPLTTDQAGRVRIASEDISFEEPWNVSIQEDGQILWD